MNEGNTGIEKREAQKRLSWIENVKRIEGFTQEQAEKKWTEIFNNNEGNTGVEKERIEKEAKEFAEAISFELHQNKNYASMHGYLAGATAERERYIAALKELIWVIESLFDNNQFISDYERDASKSAIENAKHLTDGK